MTQKTTAHKIESWANRLLGEKGGGFGGEHQLPRVLEEPGELSKYGERLRELPLGSTERINGMKSLRLLRRALTPSHPEWAENPPEWEPDPESGSGQETEF